MTEIIGTPGDNILDGDLGGVPADDLIRGLEGHDTLRGRGGADTLEGGAGNDILDGRSFGAAPDDDVLIGGAGRDTYVIDSREDAVIENGSEGNDTILSYLSTTRLDHRPNVENLVLLGTPGKFPWVEAIGNELDNEIRGSDFENHVFGDEGDDRLIGGNGRDKLGGGADDDVLDGGLGNDRLLGGDGDDRLTGGDRNDGLRSGEGMDTLAGGAGNDWLWGDSQKGTAVLDAGPGDDTIIGYSGDTLIGGAGDDRLEHRGAGTLTGGDGSDVYDLTESDLSIAEVIEDGATGIDELIASESLVVDDLPTFERFALSVRAQGETLTGNDADNQLGSLGQHNTLFGLGGNDTFTLDGRGTAWGGEGNDTFLIHSSQDSLQVAYGQVGRDTLTARGVGSAHLHGGGGSDVMIGGDGWDQLFGGGLAHHVDRMHGGRGKDTLHAGFGIDSFEYSALGDSGPTIPDIIDGFDQGQDRINLKALDAHALLPGNQAFSFIGSAAFTNQAGQLRFGPAGGDTLVEADTNGDGAADFAILLTGAYTIAAADFVL